MGRHPGVVRQIANRWVTPTDIERASVRERAAARLQGYGSSDLTGEQPLRRRYYESPLQLAKVLKRLRKRGANIERMLDLAGWVCVKDRGEYLYLDRHDAICLVFGLADGLHHHGRDTSVGVPELLDALATQQTHMISGKTRRMVDGGKRFRENAQPVLEADHG